MKNHTKRTNTLWFILTFFFVLYGSISYATVSDIDAGFGDEPLPPDQAFILTTKVVDADLIRAEWHIVDGYYMYRDKFKFESNTPGIVINPGVYPKGKIKEDEFFGEVETYRGDIAIDIPLSRLSDVDSLAFTVTSQGCADIGICYPPQKQDVTLTLPPLPLKTGAGTAQAELPQESSPLNPLSVLKKFGNSLGLGGDEEKFLPPDQAFIFSADVENGNLVRTKWQIADGYYLYRDKFAFELQDANGISITNITMPKGEEKVDEAFGKMIVYHDNINIDIPLQRTNLDATPISLVAKYQGCADAGFCYPPMQKVMPLSLPKGQAMPAVLTTTASAADQNIVGSVVSEQDQIAASLAGGNTIITIITFFGFGLLLAFTPCVFPMIPILSSIIIGQGKSITTRKAFLMSLVYVLAMAITYTAAGVIAGLFGENLQAAFQNPWVLTSFSAVFVALAFSMFGFYDIQMPNFIQSKLTEYSNKQQGGTMVGVAVMGFLSALIVGPCVAAPLAGALIYIGQTGDAVLGGMALFALSLGMGAPLLAIGVSAGKLLPKAGTWMDAVKAVFGVMMLAVAIWMLERIVPAAVSMSLWAILLIVSAIYMGALEPVGDGSGWRKLWKGLGVGGLVYGALLLIGVASGGKDALQPLSGGFFAAGGSTGAQSHQELEFTQIKGVEGLERELAKAKAQGKIVMLDFYADWCVSCKEMEKYTFSDPGVQQALKDVVLLQADVTPNDDQDKALLSKFGLFGPPSILFFDKNGNEQRAYRLVGFLNADKFESHVLKVSDI